MGKPALSNLTPSDSQCRHCTDPLIGKRKGRRGLCGTCYEIPRIRDRYPPLPPSGNRGWTVPADRLPTAAAVEPGKLKISVLAARAKARVSLFHPEDFSLPVTDEAVRDFIWSKVTYGRIRGVFQTSRRGQIRFCAYPFCATRGKHVYLGYFPTRADACREIVMWTAAGCPDGWQERRKAERREEAERWLEEFQQGIDRVLAYADD